MIRLTLSFDHWWEAEFEVDLAKAAKPCQASLDFFGDPITRDDDSPEATVRAFLQFWAPLLIETSVRNNLQGVLQTFADTEGIFPLDGSQGVQLISIDAWRWEADDFTLSPEAA